MRSHHFTILCCLLWMMSSLSHSQDCERLGAASIQENVEYLQHASMGNSPYCIDEAFTNISRADSKESVPTLLRLLTYKRPTDPNVDVIIAIRPRDIFYVYPAVAAFGTIGEPSQSALIDFIADTDDAAARRNATYSLVLIHHNYPIVVSLLHKASQALASSLLADDRDRAARLALEAEDFVHVCSPRKKKACEQELLK